MSPRSLQRRLAVKIRFLGILLIGDDRGVLNMAGSRRVRGVGPLGLGLQGAVLIDILFEVKGEEHDKVDLLGGLVPQNVPELM